MENKYRILIIEDDKQMAEETSRLLTGWNYEVSIVEDFTKITEEAEHISPQVILLDINLPSFDGFYWCKKLREITKVPIIFLSSRESSMDIVMAMNNGGDDYIQKPFDSNVLVAKLQAILRRSYEIAREEKTILSHKGLQLHLEEMQVTYGEHTLELTKNEFKILKLLLESKGQVVSRNEMMKGLWDEEVYVNENTLTVNVNRLRGHLDEMGLKEVIVTKKGIGYIMP